MPHPDHKPLVILVLGTDASGKDYFARLLREHLAQRGLVLEKRRGWLSAAQCERPSSEDKHPVRLIMERLFLLGFPVLRYLLRPALTWAIHTDRLLFRFGRRTDILLVSHTPLRLLAFDLGHGRQRSVPSSAIRALAALRDETDIRAVVVETDAEIRNQRIQERLRQGRADHFDLYMARNTAIGENIGRTLSDLARGHLGAEIVSNNGSGPESLRYDLDALWPDLHGK